MLSDRKLPKIISEWELEYDNASIRKIDELLNSPFRWIDSAWAVMLLKQKIISEKHKRVIAESIMEFWKTPDPPYEEFGGLQRYVIEKYGMNAGGSITIGRTLPPLVQIFAVRHELLKLLCVILDYMQALLDSAEMNLDAVMPGYTHYRQAQPMTYGHYLLSVFDPVHRVLKKIEESYYGINLNELGCGALAGTSLPIDRNIVSDYLGLNGLIENANDAVGFSDGYLEVVACLTNLMAVVSRMSVDLNLWSADEYGFIDVPWLCAEKFGERLAKNDPNAKGEKAHSYFMPNKTSNCPFLERARVGAAELAGALTEVAIMGMRLPHGDNHEMLHMADGTLRAIRSTHLYLHVFIETLPRISVFKDKMLSAVSSGYSCATELANQLVRDDGLDYRTAHEIVNKFVNESKRLGIPANEARIDILKAAFLKVAGYELKMSEEILRKALDPIHFVNVTRSQGGVSIEECSRMIKVRKDLMTEAYGRQNKRIENLELAQRKLLEDVRIMVD